MSVSIGAQINPARAAPYTYTTIKDPGKPQTELWGINDAGVIVGAGADNPTGVGGPVRSLIINGGTFTNFDISPTGISTAFGINKFGQVVGGYEEPPPSGLAYTGTPGSTITLTPPFGVGGGTSANGINDLGQIVGTVNTSTGFEGFVDAGGSFTAINYPGATTTTVTGINNAGQIVGFYVNSLGKDQGFLDSSGTFTSVNVPGSDQTLPQGINNSGQIVGTSLFAGGARTGFLDSGGTFTSVIDPGAHTLTDANGINDAGQIVGFFDDASGNLQGFLATPAGATVPEPTTLIVLMTGLVGLGFTRWRRALS